jgi:hypothetical protein
MCLWKEWYLAVAALRPACARTRTFLWLVLVLAAFSLRTDLAGVTSLVRSHWLKPNGAKIRHNFRFTSYLRFWTPGTFFKICSSVLV